MPLLAGLCRGRLCCLGWITQGKPSAAGPWGRAEPRVLGRCWGGAEEHGTSVPFPRLCVSFAL